MQTVLVTGGGGFVGSAILDGLLESGNHKVKTSLRSLNIGLPGQVEKVLVEDLTADTDWSAALTGVGTVVHCAARVHLMKDAASDPLSEFRRINVAGTLKLANQAAAAGVKRFVFLSSIKVNGEDTPSGQAYRAEDLPDPRDAYGVSKCEAEAGLRSIARETGLEVVIIRPPLVYGCGVKANFLKLLQVVEKGIPLPLSAVKNRRSMVYIKNLVSAVLTCIEHPGAAGQTFLVSDGEDVSTAELVRKIAFAMKVKPPLFPVPVCLLKGLGAISGKRTEIQRLTGSLVVDSAGIRRQLDWNPPYTLERGIKETVAWYQSRG